MDNVNKYYKNKFEIELYDPFDAYVESYLFSQDIFLVSGKDGDKTIIVETNLDSNRVLKDASVDVKLIIKEIE